jgi:hypothetical protein
MLSKTIQISRKTLQQVIDLAVEARNIHQETMPRQKDGVITGEDLAASLLMNFQLEQSGLRTFDSALREFIDNLSYHEKASLLALYRSVVDDCSPKEQLKSAYEYLESNEEYLGSYLAGKTHLAEYLLSAGRYL